MLHKIATFNVNSVTARLPVLQHWFERETPDILCLQETKSQDKDFPVDFFTSYGYKAAYRGMKSYNGVAVLSKDEPDYVSFGFGSLGNIDASDEARIILARFGALWVLNTYVPQGKDMDNPDFQYKLRFFERLILLLEKECKDTEKVLWLGDLNVAPTDIDVTHPERKRKSVCFCEEVKGAMSDVMSWGFFDVFRKHRPESGEFSYWDYRIKDAFINNTGWRVDHLMATKPLYEMSVDAYAVRELRTLTRPSDHTAVVGVFDI